jgi:hypothetical protein
VLSPLRAAISPRPSYDDVMKTTTTVTAGATAAPATGRSRSRLAWAAAVLWGVAVSVAHFGGLYYYVYWEIWWWDVLTHSTAGFGVAAFAYLLRPAAFRRPAALFLALPAFVLVVGAGFEVYERLFRTFWWSWSLSYYLEDTLLDLVMDTLGALALAVVVVLVDLLGGRAGAVASPSNVASPPSAAAETGRDD